MLSIDQFQHIVEADLRTMYGRREDRLKALFNHLNTACFNFVDKQININLAFFLFGRRIGEVFIPTGEVVLPWCRLLPSVPKLTSNKLKNQFILVNIHQKEDSDIQGEGHRVLYLIVKDWWSKHISLPNLPWPESENISKIDISPLLYIIRNDKTKSNDLPYRVQNTLSILFESIEAEGVCVLACFALDAKPSQDIVINLRKSLQYLVSLALQAPEKPITANNNDLVSLGLNRLWLDLRAYASKEKRSLNADDVLFVMRTLPQISFDSTIKQRGIFSWFPQQFNEMRNRLYNYFRNVSPYEHLLRCAWFIGKNQDMTNRIPIENAFLDLWKALRDGSQDDCPRDIKDLWSFCKTHKIEDVTLNDIWEHANILSHEALNYSYDFDKFWNICEHILATNTSPLDLALSNSTMDTGATEIIMNWESDKRVSLLKFAKESTAEDDVYPAKLLLVETALFKPGFSSPGALFAPIVAPVQDPEADGEVPAFGLVIIGSELVEPSIAIQIIRRHSCAIHNALLRKNQESLQKVLVSTSRSEISPVHSLKSLLEDTALVAANVISFSSRLRSISFNVPSLPVKDDQHLLELDIYRRTKGCLRISHDISSIPSPFHRSYAEMISGIAFAATDRFAKLEQISDLLRQHHTLANLFTAIITCSRSLTNVNNLDKVSIALDKIISRANNGIDLCRMFFGTSYDELLNPRLVAISTYEVINILKESIDAIPSSVELSIIEPTVLFEGQYLINNVFMRDIYLNIFNNSIEALEGTASPKIKISIGSSFSNLAISIEDNGPGFSENVISAFRRGDYCSNKDGHSGLGLRMIYEFLATMGGSIQLGKSQSLGGAKVTIKINTHCSKEVTYNE